jgi:hypothetical protein
MTITTREAPRILEDQAGVEASGWPAADHATLLEACPGGVVVVRLEHDEEPASTDSWADRVDAFRIQPYLGLAAWLQVRAYLAAHGRSACVVTLGGFPVLLADLVSFEGADDQVVLGLDRPGAWSELLHGRRLLTAAGPRWVVLGAQPYVGRVARAREHGATSNAGRSSTWSRWA